MTWPWILHFSWFGFNKMEIFLLLWHKKAFLFFFIIGFTFRDFTKDGFTQCKSRISYVTKNTI